MRCWRWRGRDGAELLHKAEGVHEYTAVLHLARHNAINHHTWQVTCLPVGGTPKHAPRCVPRQTKRLTTLSPSATCSATVQTISGKALSSIAMICLRPSRPCSWPGSGSSSTKSRATSSSQAARFPLLITSSTKRRVRALFASADIGLLLSVHDNDLKNRRSERLPRGWCSPTMYCAAH